MKLDRIFGSTHSCRYATTEDWEKLFAVWMLDTTRLYHISHSLGLPGFLKTYFRCTLQWIFSSLLCCAIFMSRTVPPFCRKYILPFAKQILNLSQNFFVMSRVTCQYAFIRCFHGMLIYFLCHFTRNRCAGSGSLVVKNRIAWGEKFPFIYRTNSDGFRWQTMTQSTRAPLKVFALLCNISLQHKHVFIKHQNANLHLFLRYYCKKVAPRCVINFMHNDMTLLIAFRRRIDKFPRVKFVLACIC